MQIPHDETIWYAFISGDKTAFSALFKMHYSSLHNYGLKISNNQCLTEDCLQDFFVYLFENRNTIGHVKSIKSYLFVSYKRVLIKKIIKERRFLNYDVLTHSLASFEFSPEDISIQQEFTSLKTTCLANMLNTLSPREREAIYLKYYSGLKVSEIALAMEISYQSTLNTIQKAFVKLRKESENTAILNILQN